MHYIYVRPKADKASLICRTEPNENNNEKKLKQKTEMLRRNVAVIKPWSQSWGQEGSLWWERFVKEVGFEPGVKERWSYGWWEWWVDSWCHFTAECSRSRILISFRILWFMFLFYCALKLMVGR